MKPSVWRGGRLKAVREAAHPPTNDRLYSNPPDCGTLSQQFRVVGNLTAEQQQTAEDAVARALGTSVTLEHITQIQNEIEELQERLAHQVATARLLGLSWRRSHKRPGRAT